MTENPITFTVSLADVPIRISCRYKENRDFLHDYLTDQAPLFTVSPTEDDLDQVRQAYDRMTENEHPLVQRYDDFFLENNAIHTLIVEKLIFHKVLLFHGSALCMDGKAYIFAAPSGTGKSTHAMLWREVFGSQVQMINDDKPLLRIEADKVLVYGTPWDGKHRLSCNISVPLKAIIDLHRDKMNYLEQMSREDAFLMLLRQRYRMEDNVVTQQILALQTALLDRSFFYRAYCNMDPEAAWTVWKGVNSL